MPGVPPATLRWIALKDIRCIYDFSTTYLYNSRKSRCSAIFCSVLEINGLDGVVPLIFTFGVDSHYTSHVWYYHRPKALQIFHSSDPDRIWETSATMAELNTFLPSRTEVTINRSSPA
nr:hypothetical protein CFP56_12339 [Quercus suber]